VRPLAAALLAALALVPVWRSVGRADAERGARAFQRCRACHSVRPGEDKLPGPNLRGVLGRRAGTLAGFRFSPAMIEAGGAIPR
jgi:cytochrome c